MTDIISRLKLESGEFDSKIKRAGQELMAYSEHCRKTGLEMDYANRDAKDFAKALGDMQTTSTTARGKINELSDAFVNLRVMYKNMTDEEKNNQFGKNLAASLDQLKTRIQDAKRDLADVTAELNGAGKDSGGGLFGGGKLDGMLQVFGGNLMTKGAGMLAGLASEMGDMVKQGIELAKQGEGIRNAFERLGRGDILDGLREATHGTVTDIELMKAAVKFNDFKLPLDELGTMLAFAQQKAKDTGQSVDYMVESLVTGLGRKSLMILDNLGLSATEVKDKMAETGDMTTAVGAIIREQMAKAGDYVETAADRAAQANVSLQNKMEELGRKFGPVEEASNQLWTSMKIGILDIIGGPLARLLNGLTEAGRLKNMLNDLNGDDGSGNTKVGQQLKKLQVIKKAGGSDYIFNSTLSGMLEDYNRQIMALDAQIKNGGKKPGAGPGESQDVRYLQQQMKALGMMRDQLAAGAKELSKPIDVKIETNGDIKGLGGTTTTRTTTTPKTEEQQNTARIAELVKQYQDLATAAKTADDAQKVGLTERMAKIQGEITTLQERNAELKKFADEARQVQYPVGSLPQLNEQLKTLQTEQAKALDAKQWKNYQRQIEQTQYQIDALKGKWKDGLQATFKLNIEQHGNNDINTAKPEDIAVTFKADDSDVLAKLRDIQGVTIDPKTLTVTANTAEAYNQVQQLLKGVDGKTVTFNVQPKMETGTNIQNDAGISGYIASIKQQLETADYGTSLYNGLSAQLADMTTLQNLVGASLKAGLSTAMFDAADAMGKDFWTRAMEGGVDNIDWQTIVDKINEARKAAGLNAISLDFASGSVTEDKKGKDKRDGNQFLKKNDEGKYEAKITDLMSGMAGGINNVVSGLNTLGVEIPAGLQSVLGGMQAISSILSGIAVTAMAIEAIAGADAIIPFANGGIVPAFAQGGTIPKFADGGLIGRAASGMMIPGNSMSGDNLRLPVDGGRGMIGVNSGELILNRSSTNTLAASLLQAESLIGSIKDYSVSLGNAQQMSMASQLEGGSMLSLNIDWVLTGDKLRAVLNNNGRRTGRGELVQRNRI